jgi:hypothetical protein
VNKVLAPSQVRFQWMPTPVPQRFRTGVSLHSHTYYSRESFDFIRRAGLRTPVVSSLIRAAEIRYQRRHGKCLELGRAWWTPPLGPGEVLRGELDQLRRLGLEGLVAITDHDDMQAPLDLRRVHPAAPLSLEWSVPFGAALLHLGIYNLPPAQAGDIFLAMQRYRDAPEIPTLPEILAAAGSDPGALVVLNHPLWDEAGIGEARHEEAMRVFLQMFGRYIHGVELNGLRPAPENERVRTLVASAGKTPISGGDRHGLEPNAVINLTNAASFSEFAEEIRAGWSHLLFLDHYRRPHRLRVARGTLDLLRNHNGHPRGWRAWTDRVFYRDDNGQVKALREIWRPIAPAGSVRERLPVAPH